MDRIIGVNAIGSKTTVLLILIGLLYGRVDVMQAGEVFGEMGLLGSKRRSARVSAYSDLVVLKVNQQKLFEILTDTPNIGYLFMRNLAAILSDRIMDMNFMWRNEI